MKHLVPLTALLACSVGLLEGQSDGAALARTCPVIINPSDSAWRQISQRVPMARFERIEACFIGGFSRGRVDRIEVERFDSLMGEVRPGDRVFIRGTADRFQFPAQSDSLNTDLALRRARRAMERAAPFPVLADTLPPWIAREAEVRGVWVYIAASRPVVPISSVQATDTMFVFDSVFVKTVDTIYVRTETVTPTTVVERRLSFGGGPGVTGLFTGGLSFVAPTLTVSANIDDSWHITLTGGWRWWSSTGSDPRRQFAEQPLREFNKRADAVASLDVTHFLARSWFGVAFGVRGGWESVREVDEYLERAYGLALGPRARIKWLRVGSERQDLTVRHHRVHLHLGIDLQYSNISEFTQGSRWRFGVAPSIGLQYIFR